MTGDSAEPQPVDHELRGNLYTLPNLEDINSELGDLVDAAAELYAQWHQFWGDVALDEYFGELCGHLEAIQNYASLQRIARVSYHAEMGASTDCPWGCECKTCAPFLSKDH